MFIQKDLSLAVELEWNSRSRVARRKGGKLRNENDYSLSNGKRKLVHEPATPQNSLKKYKKEIE